MRCLTGAVLNFLEREDGPTAVEYAVMLALIVVVCITAITALGSNANKTFSNVALNTAVPARRPAAAGRWDADVLWFKVYHH